MLDLSPTKLVVGCKKYSRYDVEIFNENNEKIFSINDIGTNHHVFVGVYRFYMYCHFNYGKKTNNSYAVHIHNTQLHKYQTYHTILDNFVKVDLTTIEYEDKICFYESEL